MSFGLDIALFTTQVYVSFFVTEYFLPNFHHFGWSEIWEKHVLSPWLKIQKKGQIAKSEYTKILDLSVLRGHLIIDVIKS